MADLNKLFVVIDPTTDNQAALLNAEWIASQNSDIALHVYEAIFSARDNADAEALERVVVARHRAWIESLVEPMRAAGNDVAVEVEWTTEWRDAIAPAAQRAGADLIIKSASVRSGAERRLLKTADWTLLRQAHCPVYLVKKDSIETGARVLLALDIKAKDETHDQLNERVIDFGKLLVRHVPDSSLHAVNAYANADSFVYPGDVAARIGIDKTCSHAVEGTPDKVIAEVAEEIDAGIVVLGTASRDGLKAAVIGNTAEKILDAVNTNILTVTAA